MTKKPVYKHILLKLSGEVLSGETTYGLDYKMLARFACEIGALINLGIQVGVVIGGGNFFRGKTLSVAGIARITGDHIGMLATLINALAMRDAFDRFGIEARIMSAIPIGGIVDFYDRRKAIYHLSKGHVVLFAAGTGNPLVTTDSAASLRAIEVGADVLIKGTNVDGIYTSDPVINKDAKKYTRLTYREAISKELGIMDLTAISQCRDHRMRICVFNLNKAGALMRIALGEDEGTLVEHEGVLL